MKLTKQQLKQIVKEELTTLSEDYDDPLIGVSRITDAEDALSRLSALLDKDGKEPKLDNQDRDILLAIRHWLRSMSEPQQAVTEADGDDEDAEEPKEPETFSWGGVTRKSMDRLRGGQREKREKEREVAPWIREK